MEQLSFYAIVITCIILGLCALGILVAGVKSVASGKQDLKKAGAMSIPFVIFGISYAILGAVLDAGVATLLAMVALMILLIIVSGVKGAFRF